MAERTRKSKSSEDTPVQNVRTSRIPVERILSTKNLSIIFTGLILLVGMLKCRQEDVPKIIEMIVREPILLYAGWLIATIVTVGSITMITILMKTHGGEVARLTSERNELQDKLLSLQDYE